MIKIRTPATSANLGAGFDSLGVAVSLYNELHIDEYDDIIVKSLDDMPLPEGEGNLVVQSVKQLYQHCGRKFRGINLAQLSPIPQARGLGSSSACIVGAIKGANHLMGEPLSPEELLDFATGLEGHPDNVAPAFLGGFVTSVFDGKHVFSVKHDIPDDLSFVVAVPDFKLSTSDARKVLPDVFSRSDCIYNISRSSLMCAAMLGRRYDLLKAASDDKLHQPYRLNLINGGARMMRRMEEEGAYCSYISGAGSSIMSIVPASDTDFANRLRASMTGEIYENWQVMIFKADNVGASII